MRVVCRTAWRQAAIKQKVKSSSSSILILIAHTDADNDDSGSKTVRPQGFCCSPGHDSTANQTSWEPDTCATVAVYEDVNF